MKGKSATAAVKAKIKKGVRKAGGAGFSSNHEFLAALEEEMRERVVLFLCRRDLQKGGEPEGARESEKEVKRLEKRRVEGLARSRGRIPWKELVASYGLGRLEELVLGYLFCLQESGSFEHFLDAQEERMGRRAYRDEWNSIGRILAIFCRDSIEAIAARKAFSMESPLFSLGILKALHLDRDESLVKQAVVLNTDVSAAIIDDEASFSHLREGLRIERPREDFSMLVLDEGVKKRLYNIAYHYQDYEDLRRQMGLEEHITYGLGTVLLFYGPPGTGKTLAARAMAGSTGRPLVMLNMAKASASGRRSEADIMRMAIDEAYRSKGILLLDECEEFLGDDVWKQVNRDALEMLESAEGLIVLSTNKPLVLTPAMERRIMYRLEFPFPDRAARDEIWRLLLPDSVALDDEQVRRLSSHYLLSGGYIKNAILQSVQRVAVKKKGGNGSRVNIGFDVIEESAREQSRRLMENMCPGTLIETGKISGWPAAFSEEEAGKINEVVSLARAFHEDDRIDRARRAVLDHGLRVLLYSDEQETPLRAAYTIADRLGLSLICMGTQELLASEGKGAASTMKKTIKYLQNARMHVVLVITLSAPEFSSDTIAADVFSILSQVDGLVIVAGAVRDKQSLRRWLSAFHRIVRFNPMKPEKAGKYLRSLMERSGWKHDIDDLDPLLEKLSPHPGEFERIFIEAVHQAVLRGADRLESSDIARAIDKTLEELEAMRTRPFFGRNEEDAK